MMNKRRLQSFGMAHLEFPVAEALRKASEMMANETICKECGEIMTDEEVENCGDMCFECYGKIDIEDYQTERPRD